MTPPTGTEVASPRDAAPPSELAPPAAEPAPAPPPRRSTSACTRSRRSQFSLSESTYLVDFWVWFRWQAGPHNPTQTFELLNLFEAWDVLKQPIYVDDAGTDAPEALGDGWLYQVYRIHGRFGRSFDVRDYPFDDQELTIAFEDNDQVVEAMVYVADDGTELVDPSLSVEGWDIDRISARVTEHAYPTNWGDPRRPAGADRYSQFRYTIHISRPVVGYLATTLVPIAIVMLIALTVFLLHPKHFEARLGLATTSLISAVALQLTAQSDLPKTGYLVLLDHVYNLSYLTIFIALLITVVVARYPDDDLPPRIKRLDRLGLALSALVFFGGTLLLVAARA
ncbi:MAG: hypothetical protein R2939_16060 [Kofleriaceae bacterium]